MSDLDQHLGYIVIMQRMGSCLETGKPLFKEHVVTFREYTAAIIRTSSKLAKDRDKYDIQEWATTDGLPKYVQDVLGNLTDRVNATRNGTPSEAELGESHGKMYYLSKRDDTPPEVSESSAGSSSAHGSSRRTSSHDDETVSGFGQQSLKTEVRGTLELTTPRAKTFDRGLVWMPHSPRDKGC
jgi:hypothetical protein